jgi:colicin import membrane protein
VTRLNLRAVRVAAEKTRKAMKEESLRTGKAIDGLYSLLAYAIVPIEEDLAEKEAFAARQKERQMQDLRDARSAEFAGLPYPGEGAIDLASLDDETFRRFLQDAKDLDDMRKNRERKAEEDRVAAEKAENERIAAEEKKREEDRARALAESKARESAMAEKLAESRKAQRAAEVKAEGEAKARELERKKEAEARAKIEKEAAKLRQEAATVAMASKEKAEAERRAANAPDRDRLMAFAAVVRSLECPAVKSDQAQVVACQISDKIEAMAGWIEKQIKTLA